MPLLFPVRIYDTCQGHYTCQGLTCQYVPRQGILKGVTMKPQDSGRVGGTRRMAALTPRERTQLARTAAHARWKGVPKAARSEAARKAVFARWARAKGKKQSGT